MPREIPSPLVPPSARLALLYELTRLFGRHVDLGEALDPLVELVLAAEPFSAGLAAYAPAEGLPLRLLGAGGMIERALLGSRIELGRGPLGRAVECGEARIQSIEGEVWVAAPALLRGSAAAAIAFRFREPTDLDEAGKAAAMALIGEVAALLGEAILLRRRISQAGRSQEVGEHAILAPFEAASTASRAFEGEALPAGGLIGRSGAMASLRSLIERVAPTDSTVLITGESGTGKELAARALHERSQRAAGPFIAVSCAALPESLIESELFGHEKGAFTGALGRRIGRFELASGGTLFLDELGELGFGVQAKLLRVLQERSFERVGGSESLKSDVRVLAATNRDLEGEVRAGRFREDLFYRLNVFPLRMPPLRERGGDLVMLADHFAEEAGRRLGKRVLRISTPALDLLMSYHWPGNVRELENAIERAVVLSADGVIHAYHLPPSLQSAASTGTGPTSTLDAALARLERELLVEALKIERGNAAAAARRLGLTERRMGLALKRFGVDWHRFRTKM